MAADWPVKSLSRHSQNASLWRQARHRTPLRAAGVKTAASAMTVRHGRQVTSFPREEHKQRGYNLPRWQLSAAPQGHPCALWRHGAAPTWPPNRSTSLLADAESVQLTENVSTRWTDCTVFMLGVMAEHVLLVYSWHQTVVFIDFNFKSEYLTLQGQTIRIILESCLVLYCCFKYDLSHSCISCVGWLEFVGQRSEVTVTSQAGKDLCMNCWSDPLVGPLAPSVPTAPSSVLLHRLQGCVRLDVDF